MSQSTTLHLVLALTAAAALPGCQQDEPAVPPQPAPQPYQAPVQQAPAQPGTTQPYPAQPAPTTQPVQPQPGLALPPTTQAGPQAQPVDSTLAAAAQPILNQLAATEAPGAKPIGAPIAGNFGQGQSLETTITLQPGKCYTVIGAGLPNVTELDIQLAPPVTGAPILAVDKTSGAQAVLGGKTTGCYSYLFPIAGPARVIVIATGGAGIAAAQVYEK